LYPKNKKEHFKEIEAKALRSSVILFKILNRNRLYYTYNNDRRIDKNVPSSNLG